MPRKSILWLASYPKSGNTWLRLFLGSYIADCPVNINYMPALVQMADQAVSAYQAVSPYPVDQMGHEEILAIRSAAMIEMISRSPIVSTPLKTHWANINVFGFDAIPPALTMGAVYLIRDPRDVCVSMARHMNNDIDEQIDLMLNPNGALEQGDRSRFSSNIFTGLSTWGNHVKSWHDTKFPTIALRYEDLLAVPVQAFTEILKFMNLFDVDEDRVKRAVEWTAFDTLKAQEEKDGFRESRHGGFFGSGKSGTWRDVLTDAQALRIEEAFPNIMADNGYELTQKAAA